MKKLMFAFACAASVAAFAEDYNLTGFESLDVGTTKISQWNDYGQKVGSTDENFFFCYASANSSEDGSTVKAYGVGDNLPLFSYTAACGVPASFQVLDQTQDKYLELSTEGGTLWRSIMPVDPNDGTTLGSAVPLSDFQVYVDTMVQFTPTEDGTAPTLAQEDQMAIWLNVDSTDPDAPVTNLCVRAAKVQGADAVAATYTVPNKAAGGIDIVPGQWYRLTVKSFADITTFGTAYPSFMVYIDGKVLKTDTPTMDATALGTWSEYLTVPQADLEAGSVFVSMWRVAESPNIEVAPSFSGVGFKGSGAIDDLVISPETPNFFTSAGSIDFTLNWDANVSAVSYTIGETTTEVSDIAAGTKVITVDAGTTVSFTATAKPWYVIDALPGATEITEAKTLSITSKVASSPEDAGSTKLAGQDMTKVMKWASENGGLTPAQIDQVDWSKDSYLMNTDLSAKPGLQITAIEEAEDGWNITVKGIKGEGDLTLEGINGTLKIKAAATLAGLAEAASAAYEVTLVDGKATIKVTGDNKNFMKATVE